MFASRRFILSATECPIQPHILIGNPLRQVLIPLLDDAVMSPDLAGHSSEQGENGPDRAADDGDGERVHSGSREYRGGLGGRRCPPVARQ
jgi:hypothetical protein